ncbi:MAG: hypothetical protein E7287_09480, partial [Lachnospiraceae bacterium]|nr:hypothetical protein [Lachnospiraceae bacterium]
SVTVPEGVIKIEGYAFRGCTGLTQISLPETLTTIENSTFSGCTGLRSVNIPDSVTSIGGFAFANCTNLSVLKLSSAWVMNESSSSPFMGCVQLAEITLPEGMTKIPNYAFYDCDSLELVILPDTLTEIGANAFSECRILGKIWIPEGVTTVEYNAFYNTSSVTIHGVTGSYAEEYANANSIPFSNQTLVFETDSVSGKVVDEGGMGIADVEVVIYDVTRGKWMASEAVTDTEGRWSCTEVITGNCYCFAFRHPNYEIESIENVIVKADGNVLEDVVAVKVMDGDAAPATDFTYSALNGTYCEITGYTGTATQIIIPDEIDGYIVQKISGNAFKNKTSLERIVLPAELTEIGTSAFSGCTSLYYVGFNNKVIKIDNYAFSGCTGLTKINIPDSVTNISGRAFENCTNLTEVELPVSWESTSGSSNSYSSYTPFSGCTKLTEITLPEGMKGIPDYAFRGCTSLKKVNFAESITEIGYSAFEDCTGLASVTVPEGVTKIESYAFRDCTGLTQISLPETLTTIESSTFSGCTGLTSVTVPEGVTKIEGYAFTGCTGLTQISLPETLTTIESGTVSGCTGLTEVTVPEGVAKIESYAFSGCTGLAQVSLPKTLTMINYYAFSGCTGLTEIDIPDGVTNISGWAFNNCTNLTEVELPVSWESTSGSNYNYNAYTPFSGCSKLTEITLPEGMTRIPDYAFRECTSLKKVNFAESITEIGYSAFENCTGLRMLDFNEKLEVIGSNAFAGCDGLVSLIINDALVMLSNYAFSDCENLTAARIPKTVTSFGTDSFWGCTKLTIYCYSGSAAHMALDNTSYRFYLLDDHEHEYEMKIETSATCIMGGSQIKTCTLCGYNYIELTEALGHDYSSTEKAATCTEDGYTSHVCSRCNDIYSDSYVNATGHSYGEWIVDKEATVMSEGSKHRICYGCENTESLTIEKVKIDIATNSEYGKAILTVVNAQTCVPIENAHIFITTENEGEETFSTNSSGQVSVILPVGEQQISVYAEGCLTRNLKITVGPGVNEVPQIGLSDRPTYNAEVTSSRMTLEEIIAAGIDPNAPGNQHVYKYELRLEFTPEIDWLSIFAFFNGDGTYLGGYWSGRGSGGSGNGGNGGNGGGSGDGGDDGDGEMGFGRLAYGRGIYIPLLNDEPITVYPVSENFYLIIRGEVSWLKEMFDVEMLILNNSMTDTLEDIEATLELPEGLSLADVRGKKQTLTQEIACIEEGDSEVVHWYVRGDTAGSYGLTASLTGMIMPFEEPINQTFTCENQIQVWAGNALRLHFEFPNAAYTGEDYPITITLTNVSDTTLYNINHKVQIVQGMEIYYSDGSSKKRIEESDWKYKNAPKFKPGDSIVIETSVNIFFESEIMKKKLEELVGIVDDVEKIANTFDAIETVIDVTGSLVDCIGGCAKALSSADLSNFSPSKLKATTKMCNVIAELDSACKTGNNDVIGASSSFVTTGMSATLNAISSDPVEWLTEHSAEDIEAVVEQASSLKESVSNSVNGTKKFDIYDSLRTSISAIPIRFVLSNVIMTEDASNTTRIPWSYTVTQASPRYFGVTNVSKYIKSIANAAMGEGYEEIVPWYIRLVPGLDDPFGKKEAIKYIQATEKEIEEFKAKDSSGEVKFKVYVTKSSPYSERLFKAAPADSEIEEPFVITCDNKTAVYENGVLTFTGDGTISVIPQNQTGGTLVIEDSEGNTYTYMINVVEQHECREGEQEVIIAPTAENDGFAVKCCEICAEVLDVIPLHNENCCSSHNFGEWKDETIATCVVMGIQKRNCSTCGAEESRFVEGTEHVCEAWEVTKEATCLEEGEESGNCSLCGTAMARKTELAEHTEGEWITEKEPSAFEEGTKHLYCSVCNAVIKTQAIPMTKETFGYGEGNGEKLIVGLPERVSPDMLISHYKAMDLDVTITGPTGKKVKYVGTGCKVFFGNEEYEVVLQGDVTGDGIVDDKDVSGVLEHVNNEKILENVYKRAGLFVNDKEIDVFDVLAMSDYIDGDAGNTVGSEGFKYKISAVKTPAIGDEFDVVISLTNYADLKVKVRGLQIDISNIDSDVFEVVSHDTQLSDSSAVSNKTSYSSEDKYIRYEYLRLSGTMGKNVSDVMKVRLKVKDSLMKAGTIKIPVSIKIGTTNKNVTLSDLITVEYSLPSTSTPTPIPTPTTKPTPTQTPKPTPTPAPTATPTPTPAPMITPSVEPTQVPVVTPTLDFTAVLAQGEDGNWYSYINGEYDPNYTGLAQLGDAWWMVVKGTIDFTYTSPVFFDDDWWFVRDGLVEFDYNGLVFVNDDWWYVVNGRIDFGFNGLAFVNDAWWYVSTGRIDFSYTGLIYFSDNWWFIQNGCVNFGYTGLAFINNDWWYVVNGYIDFGYCGLFDYDNEKWYVQGGKIDFSYNNVYYFNDTWYYIETGKVNFQYNGLAYTQFNDKWWYVINGVISFDYTGAAYANEKYWYVERGEIDFKRNGKVTIDGVEKNVAWGEILM